MSVETELAWAAGFFDGEGHISFTPGKQIAFSVAQVDRRPLDRFLAAVGLGVVGGPYLLGKNPRPVFFYRARKREVDTVIERLWPFLSEPKREQINYVRGQSRGQFPYSDIMALVTDLEGNDT